MELPSAEDRAIWDLWLSQYHLPVVLAADELGIFEFLRDRPASLDEMCSGLDLLRRSTAALTTSLAAMGFLVQHGGRFQLTHTARIYLLRDSEFYWVPMLRSAGFGQTTTKMLLQSLRTLNLGKDDRVSRRWERGEMSAEEAHASNQRFHAHSFPAALGMAHSHVFRDRHRLLDVAGGSGCYSIALALRHRQLHCTVADLPVVAADARGYIERYDCQARVDTFGFNMFDDEWPTGYDAVLFSNVLHDWDPDRCADLVTSTFNVLPRGGRIFIHEMLLNDSQDGPLPASLFSVMMLGTRGKQFSFAELDAMVRDVGFVDTEVTHTYGYYSIVSARKDT